MSSAPRSAPPVSTPFPPGTMLAGKYRVERLLGEGGMGWVVVATHVQLEQPVALKFMRASAAAEHPDAVARFVREARAAARIQSEHVARVFDVGTLHTGQPYLVMEFLEGGDLESLIRANRAFPVEQAIDYAMQACEGLAEAHAAGIVHRDLKPANLFLSRRTDGSTRVKLLDFGISKLLASEGTTPSSITSTQALMGSPLYMSPEQLRSSKNVDRRTDIWSMGIILYEMLGGRSPFEAETLPEVCTRIMTQEPPPLVGVPKPLAALVMRCLEKDVSARMPDVGTLARALAPFGSTEARAAAERISRVVGGVSHLELSRPIEDSLAKQSSPTVGFAHTNTSFGTGRFTGGPRRSHGLAIAVAVGAALVGVIGTAGVVATRGVIGAITVAPGASPGTSAPGLVASAPPSQTPSVSVIAPDPAASVVLSEAPSAALHTPSAASAASAAPAPSAPTSHVARRVPAHASSHGPASRSSSASTAAPKPASTTGFGGRD